MRVIVLAGIPGSGKSTYQQKNFPGAMVCSADHYFMKNGEYKFQPSLIGKAHAACMQKFISILEEYQYSERDFPELMVEPVIVVDNTNTTLWEISPYMQVAASYGIEAEIHVLRVEPNVAAARNVHNVPEKNVTHMSLRLNHTLKSMPSYWTVKYV